MLSYFKAYNVNDLKDLKSLSGEFIYEPELYVYN